MSGRGFGNAGIALVVRLAEARASELADALAARAQGLFSGLTAGASGGRVILSGAGLKRRLLTDARLRRPADWLNGSADKGTQS